MNADELAGVGRRQVALFLAGAAVGLTPLLVINAVSFGNPLATVYHVSQDPNLMSYRLSWEAVAWRLRFYFTDPTTAVFFYSPVLLLAVPGLLLLPRELWRERLAIATGALLTLGHLLVVGGTGDAQFPPRLLIPILPFVALGFASIWSRPPGPAARPWLLTIVRREHARLFERKRLPTVDVDEVEALGDPALATDGDANLADLRRAIMQLPDEYREPLVLQVLGGFSTAEIADQLGLSQPAVLTRLFRARNRLRTIYGLEPGEDVE